MARSAVSGGGVAGTLWAVRNWTVGAGYAKVGENCNDVWSPSGSGCADGYNVFAVDCGATDSRSEVGSGV